MIAIKRSASSIDVTPPLKTSGMRIDSRTALTAIASGSPNRFAHGCRPCTARREHPARSSMRANVTVRSSVGRSLILQKIGSSGTSTATRRTMRQTSSGSCSKNEP